MLSVEAVDLLRDLANLLRDQEGDEVCYGAFRGGNPNDFSPDECSTEEQVRAWQDACKRWDAGERNIAPAECSMSRATLGNIAFSDFGLGTYTMRRSDVDELADELDRWIDKARQVGDRYK